MFRMRITFYIYLKKIYQISVKILNSEFFEKLPKYFTSYCNFSIFYCYFWFKYEDNENVTQIL